VSALTGSAFMGDIGDVGEKGPFKGGFNRWDRLFHAYLPVVRLDFGYK